ncbi:MAG TPA: 23S rRNA (adenine(2030)-N(6))-methyltransferase RlmJ [Xanthobacteraceae bacterium]|nr:23S rRNA (adenine(2030)-N(6))-methyltransferase RlmJ [Xanthobacteraceae bacterium]
MNYRHGFHAGNFADVIKHIALTRILTYLQEKPAPFRVIDTHAGAGLYDLTGEEAQRGAEWQEGIGRIMQARFSGDVAALVAPYLDIVRSFNSGNALKSYPGSPLIARALLRPQDSLVACELEPTTRKRLIKALHLDPQARVVDLDGYTGLTAFVPPKERRGLVLIDPPFESRGEFARLAERFAAAFAKWETGSYMLWYPIKSRRAADDLANSVSQTIGKARAATDGLRVEFSVSPDHEGAGLVSAGLLIVSPPWTLARELKQILPELEKPLGKGGAGRYRITSLRAPL